jgi:hypothetical protein
MTRPVTVPLQLLQQLTNRPIIRDRVRNRYNRLEPENPLSVAVHHSPLVRLLAAFILHIVLAVAVGFPDVDFYPFDGLAFSVFDRADYEAGLAVGVVGDLGAVGLGDGVVGVEGAEDGAFGAGGGFGVVDAVD